MPLNKESKQIDARKLEVPFKIAINNTSNKVVDLTAASDLLSIAEFLSIYSESNIYLDSTIAFLSSSRVNEQEKLIVTYAMQNLDYDNYVRFLQESTKLFEDNIITEKVMYTVIGAGLHWNDKVVKNFYKHKIRKCLKRVKKHAHNSVELVAMVNMILSGKAWFFSPFVLRKWIYNNQACHFKSHNKRNIMHINKKLWNLILATILLTSCFEGTSDKTGKLSGGYYYRKDGSMSYILPNHIFKEGVYPNVNGLAFNESFILVSQIPSEEHIKLFLAQDIRSRFSSLINLPDSSKLGAGEYDFFKKALIADSSFYRMLSKKLTPNNTLEDIIRSEEIAQNIIDTSFYYQAIINGDVNYWIISHVDDKKYGPLNKSELFEKAKELNVPEKLQQEFRGYIE